MKKSDLKITPIAKQHMAAVIELLQSMSEFKPSENDYNAIWNTFQKQQNVHSVVAIFGEEVVGYGSVVIETMIRGGKMGHIENIVSHENYRKKGIGKAIVDGLYDIATEKGCYKVSLRCKEHNVSFYEKCGYEVCGLAMQRFL